MVYTLVVVWSCGPVFSCFIAVPPCMYLCIYHLSKQHMMGAHSWASVVFHHHRFSVTYPLLPSPFCYSARKELPKALRRRKNIIYRLYIYSQTLLFFPTTDGRFPWWRPSSPHPCLSYLVNCEHEETLLWFQYYEGTYIVVWRHI